MYTVYFDPEIYQTYPFSTHFKGGFMPYDEAKTYLKLIQATSIISFILTLITMAVPDIAFLSITVGLASLTLSTPMMDKGHLLTKGDYYTVKGGTWPIILNVLNVLMLINLATTPFITGYFLVGMLFTIIVSILLIVYFNNRFTPMWEEYRH